MSFDFSKAILRPNDGELLAVGPPDIGQIIIKVDTKNTSESRSAMGIQVLEPGGVIPVHLHEGMEELIFIYAGSGKTIVADDEVDLVPGTTLYVPRNVWHGITNTGTEPLRMTWTVCPPGFEDFFREVGRPVVKGETAPPSPSHPDLDAIVRTAARHGLTLKLP
jgi:oxalate decarboxylase/phosphoglucose isomerase-like protein (cupin superfamily)